MKRLNKPIVGIALYIVALLFLYFTGHLFLGPFLVLTVSFASASIGGFIKDRIDKRKKKKESISKLKYWL